VKDVDHDEAIRLALSLVAADRARVAVDRAERPDHRDRRVVDVLDRMPEFRG
jgi:hypothetical protein